MKCVQRAVSSRGRRRSTGRWAAAALVTGLLSGCAGATFDREASQQAWEARDAQRSLECQREGGRYYQGSCNRGGR
jgi:hypothetical protein